MLSGIRTIFLSTELLVPPIPEMRMSKDNVFDLYNRLRQKNLPYENLELQADPPTLSTRREKGRSICRVGLDRVLIQEDQPEIHVDDFISLVSTILDNLDVPMFAYQRCRIQCVGQPAHQEPLKLLASGLANVLTQTGPFERPLLEFGVRFRFAPHLRGANDDTTKTNAAATPDPDQPSQPAKPVKRKRSSKTPSSEFKGFMNLRIETYSADQKLVWMEAASGFQEFFTAPKIKDIGDNIRETYRFLTEQTIRFLAQYDKQVKKDG
jgi:hypothetical protein